MHGCICLSEKCWFQGVWDKCKNDSTYSKIVSIGTRNMVWEVGISQIREIPPTRFVEKVLGLFYTAGMEPFQSSKKQTPGSCRCFRIWYRKSRWEADEDVWQIRERYTRTLSWRISGGRTTDLKDNGIIAGVQAKRRQKGLWNKKHKSFLIENRTNKWLIKWNHILFSVKI